MISFSCSSELQYRRKIRTQRVFFSNIQHTEMNTFRGKLSESLDLAFFGYSRGSHVFPTREIIERVRSMISRVGKTWLPRHDLAKILA